MIENILDNYYLKKIIKRIDKTLKIWGVSRRYKKTKLYVIIEIKKEEYNDEQYKHLFTILKSDAFRFACNYDEFEKYIIRGIKNYQKLGVVRYD